MSSIVRDGRFDVVIVAGPRVSEWPSVGTRALSALCSQAGLTVGIFGSDTLRAYGVIPSSGTGGIVLGEDPQGRLHRIEARSVVKFSAFKSFPDPFPGWWSEGLVSIDTAEKLFQKSEMKFGQSVCVLGSGNRALRFASKLIESKSFEVSCIEPRQEGWIKKKFSGWEVEYRRFLLNGGKFLTAKPLSLNQISPLLWELRVKDDLGVRVLEVSRVVSAGPFSDTPEVIEYPPNSLLFEIEQTSLYSRQDDVDGWTIEEEKSRWLAGKIIKYLVNDLGSQRDEIERVTKRSRQRIKRAYQHREDAFVPEFDGKWMKKEYMDRIKKFSGVPQSAHLTRSVASIECLEEISCNICEKICPENAINANRVLSETDCTACGLCLPACPSRSIVMMHAQQEESLSSIVIPWSGSFKWEKGERLVLLNRNGDSLGTGRVLDLIVLPEGQGDVQLLKVEVPTHLLWEARGVKRLKSVIQDESVDIQNLFEKAQEKIEIILNGEKRRVRENISISTALFEVAQNRPADMLMCSDGACRLCEVDVDGIKRLACQTKTRKGMNIRLHQKQTSNALCPCLDITSEMITQRLREGCLSAPDAVAQSVGVGEGRCHGHICGEPFKRLLIRESVEAAEWIDWRFPWSEWTLKTSTRD